MTGFFIILASAIIILMVLGYNLRKEMQRIDAKYANVIVWSKAIDEEQRRRSKC